MTAPTKVQREQWREEHGHKGPDGHVGYLRDDLSYAEWCCYECDQMVPCITTRLLDALDAAEANTGAALERAAQAIEEYAWQPGDATYMPAADEQVAWMHGANDGIRVAASIVRAQTQKEQP